jgi:hypothetical protein
MLINLLHIQILQQRMIGFFLSKASKCAFKAIWAGTLFQEMTQCIMLPEHFFVTINQIRGMRGFVMQEKNKTVFTLCLLCISFFSCELVFADIKGIEQARKVLQESQKLKDRLTAIITLEEVGRTSKDPGPCVDALCLGLKDKDSRVRQLAARVLGRLGPKASTAREALKTAMTDENRAVRFAVEGALGKVITMTGRPKYALWAFLVLFIPMLLGTVIVFKIDRERKTLLNIISFTTFTFLVAKALFVFVPSWSMAFDGSDAFLYLERDFALPFGVVFCATATRLLPDEKNGRALKIFLVLLIISLFGQNIWVFTNPSCYRQSDGIWTDGVCRQSTGYTCGAASAATVLRAHGVIDAVEHECAYLSHTMPHRGVTDLGAARALRKKLPGRTVTIRTTKIDELKGLNLPCMAPLKYSFFFDHMVVVMAVDEGGCWIGDPLKGRVFVKTAELKKRWIGRTITVD